MLQLQISKFSEGSYIVMEGKPESDRFFIIREGKVQCSKSNGTGTQNYILGPGDFVGVVSCMADRPQIETAVALTEVTVISVLKEQYPDLIVKNTPVALKIIQTFASRMRKMNESLTRATYNRITSENAEQIFRVAIYYDSRQKIDIATYAYYQYLKAKTNSENYEVAKKRFLELKPQASPINLETNSEMTRDYEEDTMIFSEAQPGSEMFIIQSGEVKIAKVVSGNEVTLAVLKKGDMFGEMALLENKPRSASAIAHSYCKLMVVNRSNFEQMVTSQPQLIARLTNTLADRLWSMYRQLDNANLQDNYHKMIDMLALQIEKLRLPPQDLGKPYKTKLTLLDLATMCGINKREQETVIYNFRNESNIKLEDGYIIVKNCQELLKKSEYIRKINAEKVNK